MIRFVLRNVLRFIGLVLLQYLLNLIQFTPLSVNPAFYIIFILLLPFETPGWVLLSSAFILGISIDAMEDSFGQHAMASVFIAGIRPLVLNFIAERDGYPQGTFPRMAYFGFPWAVRYAMLLSFAHELMFYTLEAFTFVSYWQVVLKALISTLLTGLFIVLSQYWFFRKVA